eukprot:scaffold237347_cov31-Tisochrysis_lutea.AAC.3
MAAQEESFSGPLNSIGVWGGPCREGWGRGRGGCRGRRGCHGGLFRPFAAKHRVGATRGLRGRWRAR